MAEDSSVESGGRKKVMQRRAAGERSGVRAGWIGLALGVIATAAMIGCGVRRGLYHSVRPGENLYRIGKAYGVPFPELRRINGIRDPHRIVVGQRVFIPGATRRLPVRVITPEQARVEAPPDRALSADRAGFVWPIATGTLTSKFGPRGDTFHDGIDIGAPKGTPVYAARAGEVLYSDKLRGYGNVIILRHDVAFTSVYAHNSKHMVRVGSHVRQGQLIARVGDTGRTSGPNLHFEVRKGNVARNPLFFLPTKQRRAARVTRLRSAIVRGGFK